MIHTVCNPSYDRRLEQERMRREYERIYRRCISLPRNVHPHSHPGILKRLKLVDLPSSFR